MKTFYTLISSLFLIAVLPFTAAAQNEWPRSITTQDGQLIKVYQWQPESFSNGTLQANAAISVSDNSKEEPSFGMVWLTASTNSEGQQVAIRSVNVNAIKLPNESNENKLAAIQSAIAEGMSNRGISIAAGEINNALQATREEQKVAGEINNTAPKIIYSDKPSLLVVIDGSPRLQQNSRWGVETVINTPFIIVKNNNKFYLYGGKHWYTAPSATGPYAITTGVPSNLEKIQSEIAQANKDNNAQQEEKDYVISNIIVSTEPAELLQSDGEPNFTPISQTNLLYVRNSGNDIFMDVTSQQYYVLLSGRWYKSTSLSGKWNYVASDKLPADFAKIPEGSAKDNVLPSVAGTLAANDAVLNAQVPQTAKVDRKNAKADIQYDGDPRFDDIDGTDMAYAINTPGYVIRWRGVYYAVDNGVWFQAYHPNGPWAVSTVRPYAVSLIPPRYPVYAMKYVYIYDVTPDYIYMGYTPGYLNTFIYGPTVVYGTGYYYRPWYGSHYYARPYTWGFNMHYNPWTGWGFGFNYNIGWFHMSIGNYSPWGWGGWWGPAIYRPAYCWTPYYGGYRHGYYGSGYYRSRNTVIINNVNVYHNNNIYNNRRDVVTRDNRRPVSYNRNAQSAPVRRVGNARPSERTSGRVVNNNANNTRPSERSSNQGRVSPRTPSGRTSGNRENGNINNPNTTRPSRNFQQTSPSSSGNNRVPSGRLSPATGNANNNNTGSRPLAERAENANTSPAPVIRREAVRSQVQQPAVPVERQAPRAVNERAQPVQRNAGQVRPSTPAQRVERSSNPAPSSGSEGRTNSRPSGNSETRARRG
jgi:hypothetical protein